MPLQDNRTHATAKKGQYNTSGRRNVLYRNAKGGTTLALVLSEGTNSGLKLQLVTGTRSIVDDVPKATARTSVNAYFSR